jgi:hypothetical protein
MRKASRLRRRRKAWWTFTGHLRSEHEVKIGFLGKTWVDLTNLHNKLHEEEQADDEGYKRAKSQPDEDYGRALGQAHFCRGFRHAPRWPDGKGNAQNPVSV